MKLYKNNYYVYLENLWSIFTLTLYNYFNTISIIYKELLKHFEKSENTTAILSVGI